MDAVEQIPVKEPNPTSKRKTDSSLSRILKFSAVRMVSLIVSVVIAIFLTILIANMGGYVDRIRLGEIREGVMQFVNNNQAYRTLSNDERIAKADELVATKAHAQGLDRPLLVRTIAYMKSAMTLDFGQALQMTSNSGSKQVRLIVLERLPPTLLLWGTSGFLLFFVELFVALSISRKYGSFLDKLVVAMAPFSTTPAWFFGIFLILIFASFFHLLPFGGMVDAPVPETFLGYTLSLLKHMILPVMALTLSSTFLRIYQWRTFFLIYSSEDYVDMAKAKGLTSRDIERRYIMRPTLPNIITAFALTLIGLWIGGPILETVFNWPGLGRAFYQAVQFYDTPVILAETVIYAYLLVITVFLLEYIYALVDPRVKIGDGGGIKT
jgi:peptide/nickel transport system permease protein